MKAFYIFFFLIILTTISSGQKIEKRIIPQFQYTKIDSLLNSTSEQIIKADTNAIVIGSVKWYRGNYYSPPNQIFESCRNYFNIYILFSKDNNFFLQEIDNYGFFKISKINGTEIKYFLDDNFDKMSSETLSPKADTSYTVVNEGGIVRKVSVYEYNDNLWEKIKITNQKKALEFTYTEDFSLNKSNLITYKYKFLKLINNQQKHYVKGKRSRESVLYRDENHMK